MADEKNFLEQMNKEAALKKEEEKVKTQERINSNNSIESFKEESFVKTKRHVTYGPIILVTCIVLIVAIVYNIFFNQPNISISLVGLDLEQTAGWALENEVLIMTKEVYSNDVLEGIVLSQSIPEGEKLRDHSTMVLEVSSGRDPYEAVTLPKFDATWNRSSILQWLNQNGLENFTIVQMEDGLFEEDYLISFRLIGSTEETFNRSSNIEFIISQITENTTTTMENFLGSTLEQLDVWALDQNMTYTYEEAYSNIYPEGTVMLQEQLPNTEILSTQILQFTVSKGTTDETVQLPTLINMSHKEADAWFKENDISVSYTYKYSGIYPEDMVMDQSITPGRDISKAESLTITISKGEGLLVPNYSNYKATSVDVPNNQFGGTVVFDTAYSQELAKDMFISQSIKAGAYVGSDTILEVLYSLGATVEVPDFRGQSHLEVKDWVQSQNDMGASLELNVVKNENLRGNYGEVMYQSDYNKQIPLDEQIELTIAVGDRLADFSELSMLEAQALAQTVSYPIEIRERYYRDTMVGDYIGQSVEAETEVYDGTYVLVDYSLGSSVLVPNHIGQALIHLESWKKEVNELGANIKLMIYEEYDEDVAYGDIISQSRYNEYRDVETRIDVLISKGEAYHLLNLTYQSRSMIENMAEVNGLNVVFIEVENGDYYSGHVISQEPAADTWISKNDFIYVTIAK